MNRTIDVTFTCADGTERTVSATVGQTLMEAAKAHGIAGIAATCGGNCACSACHVEVAENWFNRVGPPSDMEDCTLYFGAPRKAHSRLSCQIALTAELDGLAVTVIG